MTTRDRTTLDEPPTRISTHPPSDLGLAPGTVVGRYVVVQALGHGGMGAVVLAYDTQLTRRVAIKVVRADLSSEERRARMMREAQAMARLSHPNVVAIHDVGTHEGNIYLAIEYIDGDTLRDWLKTPRPWRQVVSVMKQAARGLEAAHAAGIVHRDFKPANVLVGKDGRAYVSDFGIARAASEALEDATPPTEEDVTHSGSLVWTEKLTQEGTIVGTVGFFAPETVLEHMVDARSDQFSFCVTLWLALYGSAPFPKATLDEYVAAIAKGPPARPKGSLVPAWVHEVVRRGLNRRPDERYESMGELVAALDADPRRARLLRASALAIGAAALLAGLGVARHKRAVRAACAAEGAEIGAQWNDRQRAAVREAMTASDPAAGERVERTLQALDDFAAEWKIAQTASCEATRVTATQTAAVRERRSACLLGAREQFDVILELVRKQDAAIRRREIVTARRLPPPRLCNGHDADNAFVPLPADPAARANAEEARRLLARASAMWISHAEEGLSVAEQAIVRAREAGDPADAATALLTASWIREGRYDDSGALASAAEALATAERVGSDHIAGMAASEKVFLLVDRFRKPDEARMWLDLAEAKLARLGGDEELEREILGSRSTLEAETDHPQAALEVNARYIALVRRRYGETSHALCSALLNRGFIQTEMHDAEPAVRTLREAIDCQEREAGPDSESLGLFYMDYGNALHELGRLDEAIVAARHALEVRRSAGVQGDLDGAIAGNIAQILVQEGRFTEGEAEARRVLSMAQANTYGLHAEPQSLVSLGFARLGQGDPKEARETCERAVSLDGKEPTPDTPYADEALRCVGEAELALGDAKHARGHLEQSLSLVKDPLPGQLARGRFDLAQALALGPSPDMSRALELARQARDELREAAPTRSWLAPILRNVERWLADHGG